MENGKREEKNHAQVGAAQISNQINIALQQHNYAPESSFMECFSLMYVTQKGST
jgi:hypothetical protein